MKVELKLYKNFDADLLSLHTAGISIGNLMRIALKGYVNNNIPYFYIPETKEFKFAGRKRFLHISFDINDKKSVAFLKTEIKNRQRSAFLKSLLRSCFITPNLAIYYKNKNTIEKENVRIKNINTSNIKNLIILDYPDQSFNNTNKKIRIEEITPMSNYTDLNLKKDHSSVTINNVSNEEKNNKDQSSSKVVDQPIRKEESNEDNEIISDEDLENIDQDELMAQFLNLKQ